MFPKQSTLAYARHYGLSAPLATPNPFTTIWGEMPSVIGSNAKFLLRINAGGQRFYRFIDVIPFNLAYAEGNTAHGSYVIDVGATP